MWSGVARIVHMLAQPLLEGLEDKRARRGELERVEDQRDPDGAGVAAWIPEDGGSFSGEPLPRAFS